MTDLVQQAKIDEVIPPNGNPLKRIIIRETGSFLIPISTLPSPINKTVFDVVDIVASTSPGFLILKPKSPPIVTTEEFGPGVILQIQPKYGPASLVQLLLLADAPGETLLDQQVWYGQEANITILDVLVSQLLARLGEITIYGWAGGDRELIVDSSYLMGQLLPIESLINSTTRGEIVLTQRISHFTHDVPINQVIFTTLDFVVASRLSLVPSISTQLFATLANFPRITLLANAAEAATVCRFLLDNSLIPIHRSYYIPVLRLCLLLLERYALTQAGHPELEHPPLRLPMADLFERTIRNIIAQALAPRYIVRSSQDDVLLGGRAQVYQYADPEHFNAEVKPDIIIRPSNNVQQVAAIFDVKYKFAPSSGDHYQLNTYMNVFRVTQGGFITIGERKQINRAQVSDRVIYEYGFDIANVQIERSLLQQWVKRLLGA